MNNQDIFSGLFGGAGIFSTAEALVSHAFSPKSDDITVAVDVTLSDVYLGKKKSLILEQKKGCSACGGVGRVMTQCRACHGNGITMCTVQVVPGIIQQIPSDCQLCRGTGYAGRANCPTCHGLTTVVEKRLLDVRIPHNCRKRHELIFEGQGHHLPHTDPGDAVVTLNISKHSVFTRRECHLFMEKSITLTDAICGIQLVVETLDGRSLCVKSIPMSMIQPGSVKVIANEGMPISMHQHVSYGDLFINFSIVFPDKLNIGTCEKLKSLLPTSAALQIDRTREDVEEVQLTDYDPALDTNDDPESDDEYPGTGVQCVHQ